MANSTILEVDISCAYIGSETETKYNFDGLDLCWFYPGDERDIPQDKENFVSLLKEFREEFDKFGLLLTALVGVVPERIDLSYDFPAVSQYVHYMFAMCYNFHGHEEGTRAYSPLYPYYDGDNLNVVDIIDNFLRKGAARNKLVLGLPLHGQIYKLKNTEEGVGFHEETEGKGMPGPYAQDPGFWGYNEICREVDNPTKKWKKNTGTILPTLLTPAKGDLFISYDDAMSLTEKVELAVRKQLARSNGKFNRRG